MADTDNWYIYETFTTDPTDRGWTKSGSGVDWDFSEFAIGGDFGSASNDAIYGDTIPERGLDDELSAEFEFKIDSSATDGEFSVGFYNSASSPDVQDSMFFWIRYLPVGYYYISLVIYLSNGSTINNDLGYKHLSMGSTYTLIMEFDPDTKESYGELKDATGTSLLSSTYDCTGQLSGTTFSLNRIGAFKGLWNSSESMVAWIQSVKALSVFSGTSVQIDDTSNFYYSQEIQHSTQVLNPNNVPALNPDSGQWTAENAKTQLEYVDQNSKRVTANGTPSSGLYAHGAYMFSIDVANISTITGYNLELNLERFYPNGGGDDDGILGVYIRNFDTGEWEKIGDDMTMLDGSQYWDHEVSTAIDLSIDYSYGDTMYFMVFQRGADTTATEVWIDTDFFRLTYTTSSSGPTTTQLLTLVKDRVRAMTGWYSDDTLPDSQLTVLIDVAIDEVSNMIGSAVDLSDEYSFLAVTYFTCYLSMVAVYGPGIKGYKQDDNYMTFGDPYVSGSTSWYLKKTEENVQKLGGFITKSVYDIRTYVPTTGAEKRKRDLKKLPDLHDCEQLDDLDSGNCCTLDDDNDED